MNDDSLKWIDRNALIVGIVIMTLLVGVPASVCIYDLAMGDAASARTAMAVLIFSIFFITIICLTHSHGLPLRMVRDKIYLASYKFPSLGRKAVLLKDVKSIKYSYPERWDEKGGGSMGHGYYGYIRVEDVYDNKYRNLFFRTKSNLESFKQYIEKLIKSNLIDEDWKDRLSPLLKS